ncbi:FabD/lysophospholipase-like protein [Apiospora phragmitis]|uniref:FabD/lysophospholipase-like protein n=1 Tax=Apiospora phragmitis TaxID=2905665 RepID=A0ABR1T8K7_9PEZI
MSDTTEPTIGFESETPSGNGVDSSENGSTEPPHPTGSPSVDPQHTKLDDDHGPWERKTVLTFAVTTAGVGQAPATAKIDRIEQAAQFLPCHYFDYIAGTSTGGLSAIMLGRLRMSVQQALDSYEKFGNRVFGKPRRSHLRSLLWYPRSKYSTLNVESAFIKLISEQLGISTPIAKEKLFETPDDQTRCIVLSYKQAPLMKKPYLWRSYDHEYSAGDDADKLLNLGRRALTPIWEVARATSAAPGYFEPIQIQGDMHIDGAVRVNNPSKVSTREVYLKEHERLPALCLSIGTGMKQAQADASRESKQDLKKLLRGRSTSKRPRRREIIKGYFQTIVSFAEKLTETEETNSSWKSWCERRHQVKYPNGGSLHWWHRLNLDSDFQREVSLDDWRPHVGGTTTREVIREFTDKYLESDVVQREVQEIAAALVEIRRKRIKTDAWERFVDNKIRYSCGGSEHHHGAKTYKKREDLRRHLKKSHADAQSLTSDEMDERMNELRFILQDQ